MATNHRIVIGKIAEVTRTSPNTFEIVVQNSTFASPILQRVSRFDNTLQIHKEASNKICVTAQPMTTSRRDKAV